MNDLDRIEEALATQRLNPAEFERCAQDMLTESFPTLSPIPGGTDWGRDGDIPIADGTKPARLLATSSRTYDGVRKNMLGGIKSMKEHGVEASRLVLANPARLRLLQRQRLVKAARGAGFLLDASEIFDGGFFASKLRRDGHWRNRLLGLPSSPITLSRVSPGLAEGGWASLPLLGREDDLSALAVRDDVILSGPPGLGKSRLASEIPEVAFVDTDAEVDQIANDLRWAQPSAIVIDDAAQHATLVRRLANFRQAEPEMFTYRLIAICWPQDVDQLLAELPAARVHRLDYLERTVINQLILEMGVTGRLARAEILDQSEGRPGWAVTLADLLLRAGDAESLLRGRALRGEVVRYLRRAGADASTIDVLATIAALGGVSEAELQPLAETTGLPRANVAAIVVTAATSGLIDIQQIRDADWAALRTYTVRPPMLANALVAERAFDTPAPMVDLDGLVVRWPSRLGYLTRAAIAAAQLRATGARDLADRLLDEALHSDIVGHQLRVELSTEFMRLGKAAAGYVVNLARESFDELTASGDATGVIIEPVVQLAAQAARWYDDATAVGLLLDACLVDTRSPSSEPEHPLRQLGDLVHEFHPELPRREDTRFEIAAATKRWFSEAPAEIGRRQTAAAVMQELLGLELQTTHTDPGQPMTLTIGATVVPPAEIRRIYRELWPMATDLLDAGATEIADALIATATDWLHVGSGFDRPLGQNLQPETIAAARDVGESLVAGLVERRDLDLGNRFRLRSIAKRHGLVAPVGLPDGYDVFFRDARPLDEEWKQAEANLIEDLGALADAWASDDPDLVVRRLVEIRSALDRAQLLWPPRTSIVGIRLAEVVGEPATWLRASVAHDFLPEGCAFARRLLDAGDLAEEDARLLLDDPRSRPEMLVAMLTSEHDWAASSAVVTLTTGDYRVVQTLALRDELPLTRRQLLMNETSGSIRAVMALALFAGSFRNSEWSPEDIGPVWLQAIVGLRSAALPTTAEFELTQLFQYLAANHSAALAQLVEGSLIEADAGQVYRALPRSCWNLLHQLPSAQKLQIWRRFDSQPTTRWLLQTHLVGTDLAWLEEMLDAGEMTPSAALGSFTGAGPNEPPIENIAKLLVPRGVDPEQIAALRFRGFYWGPDSARYQSTVTKFEELSNSEDPSVGAVAAAGVRIFTVARDEAAARERRQRIRGEM